MKISKATGAVLLLAIIFYLFTLTPGLTWGDGARLQHEAMTGESFIISVDETFAPDTLPFPKLGVAAWDHPLWVILSYGLSRAGTALFPDSNPLWWVNLLTALFGAGAVALVYRLGLRLSGAQAGATAGAGLLAVSHTFWWHAATPEVYTLHAFLLLATLWGFLDYFETGARRALAAAGLLCGLALANHFLSGLTLVAVAIYAGLRFRELHASGRFTWAALGVYSAPALLAFAIIPIQGLRMLQNYSPAELLSAVTGTAFFGNLPSISILQSFLMYLVLLFVQFLPLGIALGAAGLREAIRGGRRSPTLLPLIVFGVYTVFSVFYRVTDQFAFHLTSYVMLAVLVAVGWPAVTTRLGEARSRVLAGGIVLQVLLTPFLYAALPGWLPAVGIDEAVFGIPVVGTGLRDGLDYYINPNKHGDTTAGDFGRGTLAALPENALVLAHWYPDPDEYFIFRYLQDVEGLRPDVEVIGWPGDAFGFDPGIVVAVVDEAVGVRPVYLASLEEAYYGVEELGERYPLIPELGLYSVKP